MCRELRQRGADQGAGQHVAGVVHACVDARVGDQRGERAQRDGGRWRHWPTPVANAKAAAEWPEGNERELGIRTWRASGTSPARRSGRRRRASGLTATLTTVAVTAERSEPLDGRAATGLPPASASSAAEVNERRE